MEVGNAERANLEAEKERIKTQVKEAAVKEDMVKVGDLAGQVAGLEKKIEILDKEAGLIESRGFQLVRNGRVYKTHLLVTMMEGPVRRNRDEEEKDKNKMNELLRLFMRGTEEVMWTMEGPFPFSGNKDSVSHKLQWRILNVNKALDREQVADIFMTKAAASTLGNRVIRCYPLVQNTGVIVIKGVPIDFKEEKDIYKALRLENQKRKAFMRYKWPKCFSRRLSDKTQVRNMKVEVID